MVEFNVVGFSGSISNPSKTRAFVKHITDGLVRGGNNKVYDVLDLGPSFPVARSLSDLDDAATEIVKNIIAADILVVGSPTYKGSYTGMFKHLFDLLDPASLRGKVVIVTATGGGDRHALVVEHQLRPLFGFFEAATVPTAIYAAEKDFSAGELSSELIKSRVDQAIGEALRALGSIPHQERFRAQDAA
jgi:FMN reductase